MDPNALAEEHLGLVKAIASRVVGFAPSDADFDDLVAFGHQGLVQAARRYDPERGAAFSTFAYYRIRGAMFDGLRKMGLRGPAARRAAFERRADEVLEQLSSEPSPPTAVAAAERLAETVADLAVAYVVSSKAIDEAPDTETPDPEAAVERSEALAAVTEGLAALPEPERRLIDLMYFQGLGLVETAERLGISRGWASKLHVRVLGRLRVLAEGGEAGPGPPGQSTPIRV